MVIVSGLDVSRLNVLIFTGFYLPGFKGGGPIKTISNMVDRLGDEFDFSIYTADRDLGDDDAYKTVQINAWQRVGKANVFYAAPGWFGFVSLWRVVMGFKCQAIHLNSFFSLRFSIFPLLLCRLFKRRVTVILGPRGEFSTGALHLKAFKKRVFIFFARTLGLYKKVVWHASSDFEAADIRRTMGPDVKIHVAIDIAKPQANLSFNVRMAQSPLRLVFISRISPKKNLLGAILALADVKSPVMLDVYGPKEDETYWNQCAAAALALPAHVNFYYCGALSAAEVPTKLAEYDLFFLPTLGENFGHVIAEALCSGLPLLISDTTPWRDLAQKKLGWDLPLNDVKKFAECIDACASLSPADHFYWRESIREWSLANVGGADAVDQNRQLFLRAE